MHNNYMLQVQSLINQRAISAPAGSMAAQEAPRTKQEESKPAQKESIYAQKEERIYSAVQEKPDMRRKEIWSCPQVIEQAL